MENKQALYYHQIVSIPRKCVVKSRSECDTSIDFCGRKFRTSFLPANMLSVVNEDICKWLSLNEYFYIYHRFADTRKFLQRARAESWPLISISTGVKEEDKELIRDIAESKCRVDFITIDIANAFTDVVAEMIGFIKNNLPNTKVIAGNVWGDKDSIEFLQNSGASAIKVGLSCGASCLTFPTTSFGSPMFSAAMEAGRWAKVPIILDGGIKHSGDIARATIGFMSNQGEYTYGNCSGKVYPRGVSIPMVMIGSLFSACVDAPGENIKLTVRTEKCQKAWKDYYARDASLPKGHCVYLHPPEEETEEIITHKRFFGSASVENKRKTGQEIKHIEGQSVDILCNNMMYAEFYESLTQAVKSQISYGGGRDMSCFKDVQWRVIS